jgi:hypothetical protein
MQQVQPRHIRNIAIGVVVVFFSSSLLSAVV